MRETAYPIEQLIQKRYSPRAMSGESITDAELMSLFEAARWAPSSYNAQPWRFIYAKRETKHWNTLFDLLVPFNQSWVKQGAVLMLIISHKNFTHNGKPSITHSFDTGAAWENLSLQGTALDLVVHGMQGFDYEKAKQKCMVPDDYQVEAMAAIGRPGRVDDLPPDLQEKEKASNRISLTEFIFEGVFIQK